MDALSGLMREVRSDGALFGRSVLAPSWAVEFADRAPLTLLSMVRGTSWIVTGDAEPVRIGPGETAVVTAGTPFTVTDEPGRPVPPFYIVHDEHVCTAAGGEPFPDDLWLDPRTCGPDVDGPTALLTGSYRVRGGVSDRLLTALPRVLVVPAGPRTGAVLAVAGTEISQVDPGQQAVLDRVLDLLLLTALREWFGLPDTVAPAWYLASGDPVVGPVLELLHDQPAASWTVAALADRVNVSRATLARRFTDLLGEPPMTYLAGWRLALAADLLRRTDATVDTVARQVGYANGYALSAAFKRRLGTRPGRLRAA